MIQCLPIEESTVDGTGLYFIPCIWVHGHKQGRGNFQGRGMGRALLAAAEDDARAMGAKGMAPDAQPPRWFRRTQRPIEQTPGCVNVTCFVNGWCMAGNLTAERSRRIAGEFGDRVVFREVDTSEHRTVAEWGLADALFVDGKHVATGPPPSPEKLRKVIGRRVARL